MSYLVENIMKQYISFSYNEEYLPTPRCKKLRVREVQSSTSVNIRECSKEDAPLVMVVKMYNHEDCEIRVFKGKLYRNVQWRDMNRINDDPLEQNETLNTMNWQYAIWGHDYYNDCRWSGELGDATSKAKIKKQAGKYLIIGDMVFRRTTEPIYVIIDFGLNDSAGMFVEYVDKESKQMLSYSALEREECHANLMEILSHCRNKYDNLNSYNIKVLDPSYVKFKRHKRK